MSAIAAVYNLNKKPVDNRMLAKIDERLTHRGSDSAGILIKDSVGLINRMLWTTPESQNEKLPSKSRHGLHFITCDARLDNRADLLPQLPFDGRKLEEITDSEIILAAYDKWGEDCLPHLIGDFVFAIWDEREKKLFAARDALGVKHFYYYYEPHKLFALVSEIKGLLCIEGVPRDLNEEYLGDYLLQNLEDKENTFFKNIKRLPATHALTVSENGLRIWRYWRPNPGEIKLKSAGEYQEAFREKFIEATTCRLRSAYPVGASLSGGLDSSAVVCAASDYLNDRQLSPLQTFSLVFPEISKLDARIDERSYMRAVIEKAECRANFINLDEADILRDVDDTLLHAEYPVGTPSLYSNLEIYRAARKKNVRVLLSGIDGDTTVSHGYEDFAAFIKRRWYFRLFREAYALNKNMPRPNHRVKELIVERGKMRVAYPSLFKLWARIKRREIAPDENHAAPKNLNKFHLSVLKPEFVEQYNLEDRVTRLIQSSFPAGSTPAENHWNSLTNGNYSLMHEVSEKLAAQFGIELRHPFFDRRLVEFCIGLPPGQRIYKGWTRSIFRHAMKDILPPEVQWRTNKANLSAGIKINLLKYGSGQLENAIDQNAWKLSKYIDTDALKSNFLEYKADPLKGDSEMMLILWSFYLLRWLEYYNFVDG